MKKYIFYACFAVIGFYFLSNYLDLHDYLYIGSEKVDFKQDTNYNKIATTADKRDNYENTVYERMGYIEYYDTKELQEKASTMDSSVTVDANESNKAIYEKIYQTNWQWLDFGRIF